jgi:hypothetical protein
LNLLFPQKKKKKKKNVSLCTPPMQLVTRIIPHIPYISKLHQGERVEDSKGSGNNSLSNKLFLLAIVMK